MNHLVMLSKRASGEVLSRLAERSAYMRCISVANWRVSPHAAISAGLRPSTKWLLESRTFDVTGELLGMQGFFAGCSAGRALDRRSGTATCGTGRVPKWIML
jgi:hypothetical protein